MELKLLLTQYEWFQNKLEELESKLDDLLVQIPHVKQLLSIKGIGRDTVAGFLDEVDDIDQYHHPKQITKLAGLNLKTNTSGTHKGQTKITKRGRKRLRALLFRVMMPLVAKNAAFQALHKYYTQAFMRNPDITPLELMHYIKGPDFPTSGYIIAGKASSKNGR